MQKGWHPQSWQTRAVQQEVVYPDSQRLAAITDKLALMPPLVIHTEVNKLKALLARAAAGECFVLQGGDCAEQFNDCRTKLIMDKFRILLQMSLVLLQGAKKPIVRVGRIGGQYAKPRSALIETQGQLTLPSYRGDNINQIAFSAEARQPQPELMLEGYFRSATLMNFLRALINGEFADLEHPEYWSLDFIKNSAMHSYFQRVVDSIGSMKDVVKSIQGISDDSTKRVDFFTSHEALLLPYEQALTRQSKKGDWYNLSTHFPWIGARTGDLDGAHVEYLRGINNPIGIKVGPQVSSTWLNKIVAKLNPNNEPGKIMLITRLGHTQVSSVLPVLIKQIERAGQAVAWSCDPMHGNTQTTQLGVKTRHFDHILSELKQTLAIFRDHNSHLAGVHFELTGENVTECLGGAGGVCEKDLKKAYQSLVDPRLNYEQSLEMAMHLAEDLS